MLCYHEPFTGEPETSIAYIVSVIKVTFRQNNPRAVLALAFKERQLPF